MSVPKSTFALFLGNRGLFPASLISGARAELISTLNGLGHEVIALDENATRYGAVETIQEAAKYAAFLAENRGKFDGVILSLPNFGDENGGVAALQDAGVPIFIQAYTDDMDKMSPDLRRDSFCGKLSMMDVFFQNDLKFTSLKPHVVAPSSPRFVENIDYFDRVCRVVKGLRRMRVGALGARTTPFKTVRVDEVALQRRGITVETLDMADVFARMRSVSADSAFFKDKAASLNAYASFGAVPVGPMANLVRLGVVLDQIVDEFELDAYAIRCWREIQNEFNISPCVLLGELNDRGVAGACEVDVANAVMMHAFELASDAAVTLLDWNNNYLDEDDKCILFHCGPTPASMMLEGGRVTDHKMIEAGCAFGCHIGRLKPTDFTFGSLMTHNGDSRIYLGEGRFTNDPIPADFFGVAGVAEMTKLQDVLQFIGENGYRHHVAITPDKVTGPVAEAMSKYLGFKVALPQA
jgi:L-fucose isomerase-like protein